MRGRKTKEELEFEAIEQAIRLRRRHGSFDARCLVAADSAGRDWLLVDEPARRARAERKAMRRDLVDALGELAAVFHG